MSGPCVCVEGLVRSLVPNILANQPFRRRDEEVNVLYEKRILDKRVLRVGGGMGWLRILSSYGLWHWRYWTYCSAARGFISKIALRVAGCEDGRMGGDWNWVRIVSTGGCWSQQCWTAGFSCWSLHFIVTTRSLRSIFSQWSRRLWHIVVLADGDQRFEVTYCVSLLDVPFQKCTLRLVFGVDRG